MPVAAAGLPGSVISYPGSGPVSPMGAGAPGWLGWPAQAGGGGFPVHPGHSVIFDPGFNYDRILLDLSALGTAKATGGDLRKKPSVVFFNGLLIWSNGIDPVKVYDYSTGAVYDFGIATPAAAPGLADVGSGSLAGTWSYSVRWKRSSTAETSTLSDPATITASGAGTGFTVTWTDPVITGVDKVQIWRSLVGQPGPLFLVQDDLDITLATITDTPDDDAVDLALIMPTRPAIGSALNMPKWRYLQVAFGRLWGLGTEADPNLLGWSEPNLPWAMPALNSMGIARGDRDEGTALLPSGESMIIGKKRHTYFIAGLNMLPGIAGVGKILVPDVNLAHETVGPASQDACAGIEGGWAFLSGEGKFYMIPPQAVRPQEAPTGMGLEATLKSLVPGRLNEVSSTYDDLSRKAYWSVSTDDNVHNNVTIMMDAVTGSFSLSEHTMQEIGVLRDRDDTEVVVFGDVQGNLFQIGDYPGAGARYGAVHGTVTGGDKTHLADTLTADFDTSGAIAGLPIHLFNAQSMLLQTNIVVSAASTSSLVVLHPWDVTPTAGMFYAIGGQFPVWKFGKMHFGNPDRLKMLKWIEIGYAGTAGNFGVSVRVDDGEDFFVGHTTLSGRGQTRIPIFMSGRRFATTVECLEGARPTKIISIGWELGLIGAQAFR